MCGDDRRLVEVARDRWNRTQIQLDMGCGVLNEGTVLSKMKTSRGWMVKNKLVFMNGGPCLSGWILPDK